MGFKNILWQGSSLKQDASNRLVTDKEKTIWNNKANNSHTHTKSEVGLENVDNTADSTKNVAMATKLQTYKNDSTTETYGAQYPLFAQWDSTGKIINMVCTGYTVRVQSAATADSANALNWVAGNEIKFTKPNYTTEQDLHFCWSWADNSKVKLIKQYIFDGGDGNPTQVKASQFNGPLNGNASSASSVPWSGVTGKPSTFTPSSHTHNTIQDINNNQNVTFAYSKAGMDYGDYTWLAAWNGEELRAVAKGQFATASHTHTKSQITDFPTSLKNPNKLSITVDGGDTGATSANAYDGSSAESISVSSSTHNHDLTYLKLTGGTLTGTLYSKLEPYGTSDQYIAHLGAYFSASTTENCYGGSLSIISTLKYTGIRIGYFKSSGQRATLSGGVNFHHNQDKSFGVTISGTTYYSPYIKLTTKLINQNGYYFDADYGFVMRLYNFVPIGNKNTECSIGDSTDKWKFIYATNGTIQTSNELKKNIIKDGIDNRYEELYEKLEPIAFTWNNETADGNTHDRIHLGLGAQTTKKHMDEVGITAEEYALYCEDNIKDEEGNDTGEKEYGINYGQLHALHIHMIQKLLAKVDELETRLMEFENK